MKTGLSLFCAVFGLALLGMGDKPPVTVRFFLEANAHDTDRFAEPIKLLNPPRETYIEKVPTISERMVKAIYPFQAANGTWGCAFKLDESGRISLETVSTERRGTAMVAFIGTKTGTHQVVDLLIDKPIRDAVISIPYGLTELEIAALAKEFPVLGQKKKQRKWF